jgi:membrane peptidoglycan carboxypeptidase
VLEKERRRSKFAHGEVVIEPGTGRIRAMAVNRRYSLNQDNNGKHTDRAKRKDGLKGNYPNTVNPLLGGGDMAGYQAGSTFKIFTLLAALEEGRTLSTSFNAPPRLRTKYITSPGPSACGDNWCPKNASKSMTGMHTMWTGFGKSVNTYFVWLVQKIGAQKAVRMAERLGLKWRTEIDRTMAAPENARKWGSFTLGVSDATPVEMANVAATLAAEGKYCQPLPVRTVVKSDGTAATYKGINVAAPRCYQAVSPEVARAATDAARCVTGYGAAEGGCGGSGTSPMVHATMKRPVAGKSGTTDASKTAWFLGYTPQLAAAAFVADPDNPDNVAGPGRGTISKFTVAETLKDALKGKKKLKFTRPPEYLVGRSAPDVPSRSGGRFRSDDRSGSDDRPRSARR